MIDDVGTLTRWAGTFRRLAETDPCRCAGYLAAALHLERAVTSSAHVPFDADADSVQDLAPGRECVDFRVRDAPTRTGS